MRRFADSTRFAFILFIIVSAFALAYFGGVRAGIQEDSRAAYKAGVSDGKQEILESIAAQEGGIEKISSSAGGYNFIIPGDFLDY